MDGPVFTSAGIASGIDVALALVEAECGPNIASLAAREMVVYLRRDGSHRQQSVYLDYRNHINQGVHRVQDWLSAHPEHAATLPELAQIAGMSVRSLTRQFREATGLSVNAFTKKVRLERAQDLLCDPGLTLEVVAERCGFQDARQLRRIWREAYGKPPSASRPR
jgi:transcriptional regulator GlxA family with amidase domain